MKKTIKNIAISGSILFLALLFCEVLYRKEIGGQNINIIMSLAIFVIAASTDSYIYGVVSAVIGVFVHDFLITSPRLGFSFTEGFPITFVIMLLVVFISSTVVGRIKRQVVHAREQRELAEFLYSINRELLSTRDMNDISKYSMAYLKKELHCSIGFFENVQAQEKPEPYLIYMAGDVEEGYFVNEELLYLVKSAAKNRKVLNVKGGGFFVPITTQNKNYGVFAFSCNAKELNHKQQMFIPLIAEQTAQALRMHYLMVQKQQTQVMAEMEKVKNSFLRSISHDLRTPLTGIIGSSSTLLEVGDELSEDERKKLVEGIQSDAQWLVNMIENILSITKVRRNDMIIDKSEEVAEEVVEGAIAIFHKRFPDANITVKQPEKVLLVPMDIMLISQVLTNLLENTQRHAKGQRSDVVIEMKEIENMVVFVVSDNGPGIDLEVFPNLFNVAGTSDKPYRDSKRGLGIGLSICKTIINAHGGEIYAENLPHGGAQFMFTLPINKEA